jgi:DNA polymerase-3 subunit gamma/tau
MAYLSLYRKYRPRRLSEVVGQEHVTRTLTNAVKSGRISHAYLFSGPRGTGKTSTARCLALSLNCEQGPAPEPCGGCGMCESIREGNNLDVIEFDAASHRGVDYIDDLRKKASFAPARARFKVYIIDEVHQLSDYAFDALLKTLEEPPPSVIFLLATTEPHKVPPTILSRCQRFDFHRIARPEIEGRLGYVIAEEKLEVEPAAIRLLAQAAQGSVRDALSLLDQAQAYAGEKIGEEEVRAILGGIDFDLLAEFAGFVAARDLAAAFAWVDRVVAAGKDLPQVIQELVQHFRDLLLVNAARAGEELLSTPSEYHGRLSEQSARFSAQELLRAIDLLCDAERSLRDTSQQRLLLEVCALRLCEPAAADAAAPAEQPAPPRAARKPSARPAEQAPPPAGELDLAFIRSRWPELKEALRKDKQTRLAAFLFEAEPTRLEGDCLTLCFRHEFHRDQMDQPERQAALGEALHRLLGVKLSLRCEMAAPSASPSPPAAARQVVERVKLEFPGSEEVEE